VGDRGRHRPGEGGGPPYAAGSRTRLIVSLALATSIPYREWAGESDEVIVTALQLLQDQAEEMKG
jgi:hypothetical protein